MINIEQVYSVIASKGPIIPNKIKQILSAPDSTLINVYVSELKAQKRIELTHLQLGSSSFAYTNEQKHKLTDLIKYLNEKDQRVANKLKEEGVIRANTSDPLTRVSLSKIKDFAKPLKVQINGEQELFYKWYLLPQHQAEEKIKQLLGITNKKSEEKQNKTITEHQTRITQEPKPAKEQAISKFLEQIKEFFSNHNIVVDEIKEIRKNSEVEAIIRIKTSLGEIPFFCRAKNKKNSSEGELASTLISANARMLNAMYVTTGTVTKKARQNPELKQVMVVELGRSNK